MLTRNRHNKKQVDLSLTYRLANLPSGAQLELVQSSKSPAVVNVALQFPQAENNLRLTEKFPSSTSLWQVLRRFESGTAGGTPYPLNITQRGIAERNTGSYGAGRMFYEMPTLNLMNREFGTFVDLQKTLAAVGVTSGSALLRLNFKHSGKPLEEAMAEISQYFKESEEETPSVSAAGPTKVEAPKTETPSQSEAPQAALQQAAPPTATSEPMEDVQSTPVPTTGPAQPDTATSSTAPKITTFLAPEANAPAASRTFNEEDYVPTVDHAKTHQARLETLGKNQRLLSDRELDEQRKEKEAKTAAVSTVSVRFRMPDQTQIQTSFTREDTAQSLFATMTEVLRFPDEAYQLSYRDSTGKQAVLKREEKKTLIQGLGWTGNTLVYVSWAQEGVSEKAKGEPALKDESVTPDPNHQQHETNVSRRYLKTATKLHVEEPKAEEEEKKGGFLGGLLGGSKDKGKAKSQLSAGEKEAKLGKLLGLGKKK